MKKLIVILFLFILFKANSQEATLRILGQYRYTEVAEKALFLLTFENYPDTCNPKTQNLPIETQKNNFESELKKDGMSFKLTLKDILEFNSVTKQSYVLELPLETNTNFIKSKLEARGIKLEKSYYKYPIKNYSEEDDKAILSLQNAQEKAANIIKILNYKAAQIVSIDDDTSDANSTVELLKLENYDNDEKQKMLSFFEELNDLFAKSADDKSTKEGAYNLWVTFKIAMK